MYEVSREAIATTETCDHQSISIYRRHTMKKEHSAKAFCFPSYYQSLSNESTKIDPRIRDKHFAPQICQKADSKAAELLHIEEIDDS